MKTNFTRELVKLDDTEYFLSNLEGKQEQAFLNMLTKKVTLRFFKLISDSSKQLPEWRLE